jgi:hypothetical protein
MCLWLQFCTHLRVWVLHFSNKIQILCTLFVVVTGLHYPLDGMWGGKTHSGERWERGLSWVGSANPTKQGKHFTQTLQYYRPAGVDGRLMSSFILCLTMLIKWQCWKSKTNIRTQRFFIVFWESFFFYKFEPYFTVAHAEQGWAKLVWNLTFSKRKALVFWKI